MRLLGGRRLWAAGQGTAAAGEAPGYGRPSPAQTALLEGEQTDTQDRVSQSRPHCTNVSPPDQVPPTPDGNLAIGWSHFLKVKLHLEISSLPRQIIVGGVTTSRLKEKKFLP